MKAIKINKITMLEKREEVHSLDVEDHELIVRQNTTKQSYLTHNCNFGLLFGAQPATFVKIALANTWTMEDCNKYIEDNDLEDTLDSLMQNKKFDDTLLYLKQKTVASDMKNKFFLAYPGFAKRLRDSVNNVTRDGFIRSYHGAFRHFPEMLFKGKDDDKINSRTFASINNTSANTDVQNFESVLVMRAIVNIANYLKENNIEGYLVGSVHDSMNWALPKDTSKETILEICAIAERPYREYGTTNITVDGVVTDLRGELGPKEMYSTGTEIEFED